MPRPSSTVASTFNLRQYLQSFETPKQICYVLRGIKRAIPRKLVKIFHSRVPILFLKQFPAAGYLDTCTARTPEKSHDSRLVSGEDRGLGTGDRGSGIGKIK